MLLVGNVGGVLDHFHRPAALVENGVVRRLKPDVPAVAADTAITARVIGALAEFLPEGQIFGGFSFIGVDEHAVVLPQDLVQGITHGIQEILIGHQDMAFQIEFDNGLGFMDR
ncbi:hypothetical protein D3C72_2155650 [compost metagenome]